MNIPNDPVDRWDWSSTAVVLLLVVVLLSLTFEMWAPHFDVH